MRDSSINDETRDRAVRWVLWGSLGLAVAPMAAALVLVQPALDQLRTSDANEHLRTELTAAKGDTLGAVLSRSASGFVRAVQATFVPSDIPVPVPDLRPLDDERAARRFTSTLDRSGCGEGVSLCVLHSFDSLRPAGAARQTADAPVLTLAAAPISAGFDGSPAQLRQEIAWRALEEGVYVADVGVSDLVVAGAVVLNDFSALRPIDEVGVGGYLAGAPELHHGAVTGGLARTFEQGRWRVRPEFDLAASYLDLEKVRLDVGEAGLFLPETDDWIFSARPSLAFEGEIDPAPGFKVVPSFRAGATWLSQTEYSAAAMMLDAPARVAGLDATLPVEELLADVEAGLGLAATERFQLSVRYGRVFGEAVEAQTGRVQLNMQF